VPTRGIDPLLHIPTRKVYWPPFGARSRQMTCLAVLATSTAAAQFLDVCTYARCRSIPGSCSGLACGGRAVVLASG